MCVDHDQMTPCQLSSNTPVSKGFIIIYLIKEQFKSIWRSESVFQTKRLCYYMFEGDIEDMFLVRTVESRLEYSTDTIIIENSGFKLLKLIAQ